jgi:hypothetical protein
MVVLYGCLGGSPSHISNEADLKTKASNENATKLTSPDTVVVMDDGDSLRIIYETIQENNENEILLTVFRNKNELFSRTITKNDIFSDDVKFKSKVVMEKFNYTDFDKKTKEIIFTIYTKDPDMEVTVVVDLKGKLEVVTD